MSAFEGLRAIRVSRARHPAWDEQELLALVQRLEADSGYDYEAALLLNGHVAQQSPHDAPDLFYRDCIEGAIRGFHPIWGRIITLGRKKFLQKLERDQAQCFRAAGL